MINPQPIESPSIYTACRDFVAAFALPALAPANIIQGWGNRASLPAGTNDYAVISILFDTQHGTTVESTNPETGDISLAALTEIQVQIDICAENDIARQRTRHLATAAKSSLGVQFFNKLGLSILFADDVRDLSFIGDANQFVRRYMTTLHITSWTGLITDYEYFDQIKIARIENIDVHHPVKGA